MYKPTGIPPMEWDRESPMGGMGAVQGIVVRTRTRPPSLAGSLNSWMDGTAKVHKKEKELPRHSSEQEGGRILRRFLCDSVAPRRQGRRRRYTSHNNWMAQGVYYPSARRPTREAPRPRFPPLYLRRLASKGGLVPLVARRNVGVKSVGFHRS